MLAKMRNVGEHIDDYAVDSDRRRYREVVRFDLHVGAFDGTTYEWLGESFDVDKAQTAAIHLSEALRSLMKELATRRIQPAT